ncbi:hypothetical protein ES705_29889 [subsurface metagenome]
MPGKIAAGHHTLADWDFESGALRRSLSADYFISAPTSVKITSPGGTIYESFLCRIPGSLALAQGEWRTWQRFLTASHRPCIFRNQAALGSSNMLNTYWIGVFGGNINLGRFLAGAGSARDSFSFPTPADVWVHWRFFWYNGLTPGLVEALCVDVYTEIAGEWVSAGPTLYDTANTWKDSGINRCGAWSNPRPPNSVYYDDSEVWGPV